MEALKFITQPASINHIISFVGNFEGWIDFIKSFNATVLLLLSRKDACVSGCRQPVAGFVTVTAVG